MEGISNFINARAHGDGELEDYGVMDLEELLNPRGFIVEGNGTLESADADS